MSQGVISAGSSIVAVYPDHAAAEQAVRRLHEEGFAMADLSIIGRDFQMSEEPVGFVDTSQYAKAGAGTGAWFGGLFGLMVGAGLVLVPGVGPVVVAGPLAAALMAGLEGAIAGTALGGLAGALVGWGIPKDRALHYERHIQGGKFLVLVRGVPGAIARARELLAPHGPEDVNVYEPPAA
jgi:uncharacterized membrane protein